MITKDVLILVWDEVERARSIYPDPSLLSLAFAEESGEVIKELLDLKVNKNNATLESFQKECIQAAAMAIRLYQEGDPAVCKESCP